MRLLLSIFFIFSFLWSDVRHLLIRLIANGLFVGFAIAGKKDYLKE